MIKLSLAIFTCLLYTHCANAQLPPKKIVVNGVTAHRGHSAAFPENTLASIQGGIDARADWVELDIFKTKDGKIVVCHDPSTGRVADKNLVIADATFEELSKLDMATDFRKRQGLTIAQCPIQRIPLLSDALAMIMKQKLTSLSIQPKTDIVADAIAIVRAAGAEKMVGFNDGNLKLMSDVKRIAPQIPVFWDRPANTDIDEDIRIAKQRGFEALIINYKGISPDMVRKVKNARLQVGVWTVNKREDMLALLKMGVERIYSDDPSLLIEVKRSLGNK
ncbi:glycerophosphodiester phosphodiesterase [Daejeonella lutea]|uniref:Glycerophosphoryl diester phosphodiesterase n=1 Tax=Daejeonella lutea TaxID=572036 RepID=A0A1T5ABX8_9SPHI|nr:glycerophosphodiester phosphodiesterase family protein [Daejeonella lutea]SKB32277.1 glycerophosphoryl diester phosphodiesterase [Daejeonella lutea]